MRQRFREGALRRFVRLVGILQGLPGVFVGGLVIFFSVADRSGTVCVRSLVVQFRGSLVRIVWHGVTS